MPAAALVLLHVVFPSPNAIVVEVYVLLAECDVPELLQHSKVVDRGGEVY